MSFYGNSATCQPPFGWWMMKEPGGRGGGHRGGGRHRHGGPGGGQGGGFDPRGMGFGPGERGPWGGGPRGPRGGGRRRRGDVRIALLLLLAEEPRNGYQLMQTIEERSGGRWRPSPGSVYPALQQLQDEGFVRETTDDGGRVFEITDEGRKHLEAREETTPPWQSADGEGMQTLHELRSLVFGLGKAAFQVVQVGNEQQWAQAADVLDEARRSLYRILAEEGIEPDGETDNEKNTENDD